MKHSYLFICLLVIFLVSCSEHKTVRPELKDMVDAVYASGTAMPAGYYKLSSSSDGNVKIILVGEGDYVKTNQFLMLIDPDVSDWKSNAADAVYQQAVLNASSNSPVLRELSSALQTLELKYKQDSLNADRFKSLWDENAVSKIDYEKILLTAQSSRNEYLAARERLQKTIRQVQVELKNAEANWLAAGKEGSEHRVKALGGGMVYELYKKQGELVRRGEALALLGSSNEYILELWVDEEDIFLVKPGQEVLVTTEVYKDSVFTATISKIYPSLNPQRQSFKVEAKFLNQQQQLPAQCNVEANIVIRRTAKALVIPKYCLVGDSVQIEREDGAKMVFVKTGIDQGDYIQITEGISKEDVVIVPDKKKKK